MRNLSARTRVVLWTSMFTLPVLLSLFQQPIFGAEALQLEVSELAGIRRFSYPVTAKLKLPRPVLVTTGTEAVGLRLRESGKTIRAQFSPLKTKTGFVSEWMLDFNANYLPFESRCYVVEYGTDVPPTPPAGRMKLEQTGKRFNVFHSPGLQYSVSRNLAGLLRSAKTRQGEFLRGDSPGLLIRMRDGSVSRLGQEGSLRDSRVVYQGPMACELCFQHEWLAGAPEKITSVVRMHFPGSKSWVRIDWSVVDRSDQIASLEAELSVNLASQPALVDFGAGSLVYATLATGQVAELRALPSVGDRELTWGVYRGQKDPLEPFVLAPRAPLIRPAEGWAHVMDQQRATAMAVAGFSRETADRLRVGGDGQLRLSRAFGRRDRDSKEMKTLTFWCHFVSVPLQIGAMTSAQSMQNPLRVTVR